MITFTKNDRFQCLVQFADAMTASNARMVCTRACVYACARVFVWSAFNFSLTLTLAIMLV